MFIFGILRSPGQLGRVACALLLGCSVACTVAPPPESENSGDFQGTGGKTGVSGARNGGRSTGEAGAESLPGGSGGSGGVAPPDTNRPSTVDLRDAANPLAAVDASTDAGDTRMANADPTILPVLLIDIDPKTIVKGIKKPAKVRLIEQHDGTLTGIEQRTASLETQVGIELRGAWSLQFVKKGFSLEIQDATGKDRDVSVLGMPADSDYALRAGFADHTLIRDALAYWMFQTIWGRYAPRTRLVELYLGKMYWGVYLLSETIKRGKHRVDLPKVAPDAASGDLTGGYIVHLESSDNDKGFVTSTKRFWDYRYPSGLEITSAQATYIKNHIEGFEKVMMAPSLADPKASASTWIDVPSFVDFALFQELSRNTDGYTKSSYYQKQPDAAGGKLIKGPVWDLDLGYGNLGNGTHTTEGWLYDFNWNIPVPWWALLWKDTRFRNTAVCRWQELRKNSLSSSTIDAKITELAASLTRAQPRENARWNLIGKKESFHAFIGKTYTEDVTYLKSWIAKRLVWLDTGLSAACQR